jgi:threonine dehydrogenase-like Zn-dependent dehydrogenase
MRAVEIRGDGGLAVTTRPDPEPQRGEVVVAVERCGICGSDIHAHRSGSFPAGTVMGHEISGTVAALGADVVGLSVGDRVAVMPAWRCGECANCLRDGTAETVMHCLRTGSAGGFSGWLGLGLHVGGFAEYVRGPARMCYRVPDGVSWELAALVEPYTVALHAIRRSAVARGGVQVAAVLGAGAIGLMTALSLRLAGVPAVLVAEPREERRAAASAMGAEHVGADVGTLAASLGELVDVVFDCTGVTAGPQLALDAVRLGGQIVLVGIVEAGERVAFDGGALLVKEVDVVPSVAYSEDDFSRGVADLQATLDDPVSIIESVVPLEETGDSLLAMAKPGGPVKVQVAPGL